MRIPRVITAAILAAIFFGGLAAPTWAQGPDTPPASTLLATEEDPAPPATPEVVAEKTPATPTTTPTPTPSATPERPTGHSRVRTQAANRHQGSTTIYRERTVVEQVIVPAENPQKLARIALQGARLVNGQVSVSNPSYQYFVETMYRWRPSLLAVLADGSLVLRQSVTDSQILAVQLAANYGLQREIAANRSAISTEVAARQQADQKLGERLDAVTKALDQAGITVVINKVNESPKGDENAANARAEAPPPTGNSRAPEPIPQPSPGVGAETPAGAPSPSSPSPSPQLAPAGVTREEMQSILGDFRTGIQQDIAQGAERLREQTAAQLETSEKRTRADVAKQTNQLYAWADQTQTILWVIGAGLLALAVFVWRGRRVGP